MATISGMTATAMQAIVGSIVNGGSVDGNGHLILTTRGGGTVDAGVVRGAKGDMGQPGVDGATPLYWTGASASAAAIHNAAWTTITGWSTVDSNNTPYSGIAGGIFTMSKAGFYLISVQANWDQVAGARRIIRINKNGLEQRRFDISSATSYIVENVSHAMAIAVGDTVDFQVYQNTGDDLNLQASPGHKCDFIRMGA